ncbi:tyrosine-type recombinase/integrase [Rhodopila sp.]|uniref:tyrosine-type recombinase/integrase n=1 Tax=Rhodopila sp. TaxID=2480087 RepID=UPI003D12D046
MARKIGKLSSAAVKNANKPGLYGDGVGLYLNVGPTGGKSWLFRFMLNGAAREMGLGPLHTIGLAEARERAAAARKLRLDGIDPLDARRAEKVRKAAEAAAEAAALVTFRKAAESYIEANKAAWRNEKHAWQWGATLAAHVYPVIGDVAVSAVNTGHVTRILTPIWNTKAETAARVRGRIETVLDFAKVHGWRAGENPARWKGHLDNVLPARAKVSKVEHHAALPWTEIGAFMAELEKLEGVAGLALRFAILTAARTGEVIGATWAEIDLKAAVWTVPGARMKAGAEHRVPLSDAALAVLRQAAKLRQTETADAPVFAGGKGGKASTGLSNMAMLAVLRRMGRDDLTVHGFRSSFRDWAAEATRHEHAVVEKALAHTIDSKVEAAYRRGDLFEKRQRLMNDWAAFCGRTGSDTNTVLPIRAMG